MIDNRVLCDVCSKELQLEDVDTPFGPVKVVKTYKTKEWNTKQILPHLCETCAMKIDNVLLKAKNDTLEAQRISQRNAKLNAARRKQFNTKG